MANQQIFVLGSDGNLWLEDGPFGKQIPPPRVQVDGSVNLNAAFQAFFWNEVFVCGSDGNLWLEQGPFGTVPLDLSGQKHTFSYCNRNVHDALLRTR